MKFKHDQFVIGLPTWLMFLVGLPVSAIHCSCHSIRVSKRIALLAFIHTFTCQATLSLWSQRHEQK